MLGVRMESAAHALFFLHFFSTSAQVASGEEVLFDSATQARLEWTSIPPKSWKESQMSLGSDRPHPIYQACIANQNRRSKTLWTQWVDRKDAVNLLLDIKFLQEVEASSQLSPLSVYLTESDAPMMAFRPMEVLRLTAPVPVPADDDWQELDKNLHFAQGLSLGTVSRRGVHLGFDYAGPCVLIAAVRLYYRKCPPLLQALSEFGASPAGAGPNVGRCVSGSREISPPQRVCGADGSWGPLHGRCVCAPGHQEAESSCEACSVGSYRPARDNARCLPCPPNSESGFRGAVECRCVQGHSRLPSDPVNVSCARPPSAPVNLTYLRPSDSSLTLHWGPPVDLGGREEVTYTVECWLKSAGSSDLWQKCGRSTQVLPASREISATAAEVTGVEPRGDYRFSVRADNVVSRHFRSRGPEVFIAIYNWKVMDPTSPGPSDPNISVVVPVAVAVAAGGLALLAAVACCVRRSYKRLDDEAVALQPGSAVVTYRRDMEPQSPLHPMAIVPAMEGWNETLLSGLKEVVVDRKNLTLGKELGRGEFGSVYEGIFTSQDEADLKVAVKTMRVGIYTHEDLDSFLKEAEIMKHMDHNNVVKLLGVTLEAVPGSPVPMPLVILPFMQHGDLRRFLIATRYGDVPMFVPHQSLLRFMVDIAAGMEHLSSREFLHRDLAARNCMLGDDLRVRVADFGLSKKIYSKNYYRQKVAIRLPIKWMAIESLAESIFSIKTDVWSFGVTMWEIVTRGRTPYPGVPNHELLELLESGHRPKATGCDSKLYAVMQSCWHSDPAHRPGFGELGLRLKALLSELPPLDASKEAHYINQGLMAASQGVSGEEDPDSEEGAVGNIYLSAPVGASDGPKDEAWTEEQEDGYLLCIESVSAEKSID
ncbi:ephrin type-A receptor 4-B isoform X2 [Denticeps clupeoides]|uniref:receptor protein-tyrosine kinase n=1 Tax=Denticeps clupeoides TaxID=299321 RepID=A0AAY4AKU4_9TELE|nr:ephrin type-A receptor 4-B-like isoform X2 [Denticeps clupeoides]